jgi:hypothetical protein
MQLFIVFEIDIRKFFSLYKKKYLVYRYKKYCIDVKINFTLFVFNFFFLIKYTKVENILRCKLNCNFLKHFLHHI